MLFRKNKNIEIPEKFQEEVIRLKKIGYKIISYEDGIIQLRKWKLPPLTFLIFLFFPYCIFLPWAIINWILVYKFVAKVYEKDGAIITE